MHERKLLFAEPTKAAEDDDPRVLYSSDKESIAGVKKFFSMLDSRRAAAREAIAMVLKRTDARERRSTATGLSSDFVGVLESDANDR